MDADVLTTIRTILELGWPAIVLLICWLLWRAYVARTDQYINDLRELAGLRVSLAGNGGDKNPAAVRIGMFGASDETAARQPAGD